MHKAVFLDRDGTIAKDVPYCSRPEDFDLLPGAAEGIRLLNEHGLKVIVVTNQSGIARGYFTEDILTGIHDKMQKGLAEHKAHVDAIYYCPHHPDDNCDCRKPKTALLLKAANDLNIDVEQSYMIGDADKDVQLGKAAGCKACLLVWQNQDKVPLDNPQGLAFASFFSAVEWIINHEENRH